MAKFHNPTPIPPHLIKRVGSPSYVSPPAPRQAREEIVVRSEAQEAAHRASLASLKGLSCPACQSSQELVKTSGQYPLLCRGCGTTGDFADFGGLSEERQAYIRRSGAFRPLPQTARQVMDAPRDEEGKWLPQAPKPKKWEPQVRRKSTNVITVPGRPAYSPPSAPLGLADLPQGALSTVLRCPVCATLDVRQEMTAGILRDHLKGHGISLQEAEQIIFRMLAKGVSAARTGKGRYEPEGYDR